MRRKELEANRVFDSSQAFQGNAHVIREIATSAKRILHSPSQAMLSKSETTLAANANNLFSVAAILAL